MGIFSKIWHALTGWLKPDVPSANGYNLEKQGTNNPIPVIYGTYNKAPCIKVLKVTSDKKGGAKNEYLHLICVFCEGEINSIGTLYFNGISESTIANERYTIERYTGTDNQSASATLINEFNGWNINATLSGVAYAYVRLKIDKKNEWWQGEPEITADIKGKKIFDPRTSITAFSDNAVLCFYDFFTNTRYGKGTAASKIDIQSFINKANYTETQRTYTRTIYKTEWEPESRTWIRIVVGTVNETVTENLFSCNALLDTSKKVKENLDELRKCMRAILPESNGKHRIVIEKEGTPVYAFTKDNLIGGIDISGGDLNNRYNQVIVKFRNYLTGEQDEAYYPVDTTLKSTWLSEDNNKPLLGEFTFDTINNKAEALQMATVIALRSRQQLAVKFNGMPETFVVEVGDIVSLDSTIAGFVAKPFRLEHATLNIDTGEMVFQAIEHQNTIYPWSVTDSTEEYTDTSLALPSDITAPTNIIITTLPSDNQYHGSLTWDDPNDVMVSSHKVEIVLTSDNSLVHSEETTEGFVYIPFLAVGDYNVSVYAQNSLYQSTASVVVFSVATPVAPATLGLSATNFEIIAQPISSPINHFTEYQLYINTVNDQASAQRIGNGKVFSILGRSVNTEYFLWGKTITPFGESGFVSESITTTNDPMPLLEFLGLDADGMQETVFDGVVNELQDDFERIAGNPVQAITDILNGVYDNFETGEDLNTEQKVRITETKQLTADLGTANANIVQTNQVIADETSARATSISQVNASISNETSTRTAEISRVDQSIVDETSARATSVSQVNASISNETSTRTAEISRVDQAVVDEASARATAITALQANSDFTYATITKVDQVETNVNGNASAISGIRTAVAGTDNQAQAELILSSTISDTGTLKARAYFGTTTVVAGVKRINGIIVNDDGMLNNIEFKTDAIRFVDNLGNVQFYWDAAKNKFVFAGELVAATGSFSGTISAATGSFSGYINSNSSTSVPIQGVLNSDAINVSQAAYFLNLSTQLGGNQGVFAGSSSDDGVAVMASAAGSSSAVNYGVKASANGFDFYASGFGVNYGPFTGAHDGLVDKNITLTLGDIVCDVRVINIANLSNALCELSASTSINQRSVRGVVVHQSPLDPNNMPAALDNSPETALLTLNYDRIAFNAVGEGAMNVCGEGGDIEIGDLISSSSISGKGMKQLDQDFYRPYTVAQSRQKVTFSSATQIQQIAVIYQCG